MTEYQLQSALFEYAAYQWWREYFFSIPNEQLGGPKHLGRLKKMGIKPGVPDTFLAIPSQGYHGMFLELKRPGGKPTSKQLTIMALLNKKGYYATWKDDLNKSIKIISNYLKQ